MWPDSEVSSQTLASRLREATERKVKGKEGKQGGK